jgi:hypothetical protein
MPDQPKDLNVGQIVKEVAPIVNQAPEALAKTKAAIDSILTQVADTPGPESQQISVRVKAIKAGVDSGLLSAEEAFEGLGRMIKQFAIPLAAAGGVQIHGSGQVQQAALSFFSGIQSSMTHANKILHVSIGVLQSLLSIYGIIVALAPSTASLEVRTSVGTLSIGLLAAGIARFIAVFNANYPDAPKAQLVSLPPKT